MTLTDKINALLAADPICNGRVTGDTVRAIAGLVSERDAIVAWLRDDTDGKHSNSGYSDLNWAADAIERGDFGAGER